MKAIKISLQFEDKGYGLTHFVQRFESNEPFEIEAKGFRADEGGRVNAMVLPAWEWVCRNEEEIKSYLARELVKSFNKMRSEEKKHVPDESYDVILEKLPQPHRITFYDSTVFDIFYWIVFNDVRYQACVTVHTDSLTYKNARILTMGGFKAPKPKEKPTLKTAAALYAYHLDNGNAAGLYKYYTALSAREIDSYIDLFMADKADIDDRIDCLLYLALFSGKCGRTLPDKLYDYLIENGVFYYGEIYSRADTKFAGALIEQLGTVDDEEAYRVTVNHILCALSAIPCKRTNDFLMESSCQPLPVWARNLHALPKNYAHTGGWETAEDGIPILLTDEKVTGFERCGKEETSKQSPLAALTETCGFCGQPLTLVFDGEHKLATCMYCACYQNIYMKADKAGVHWHEKNEPDSFFRENPQYMKNDEEITAGFTHGLRPAKEKRQPLWTAHQYVAISRTQMGGLPTAVNDVFYPQCPDCGKTMRFTAQLDMADVEEVGEGLYYFFVCGDCGVTAANYDQS